MWALLFNIHTITHSIPINLFIKLGLNVFSVPPVVGIVCLYSLLLQTFTSFKGEKKGVIFFCSANTVFMASSGQTEDESTETK